MAKDRLTKGEFYDVVANLDDKELKQILWTMYWRGPAAVRERISELLGVAPEPPAPLPPDPEFVLSDVTEFVELARKGAYLAGDRRVTPKERTRWRFRFRQLVEESLQVLREDDEESARAGIAALTKLVHLAVDTQRFDFFRSEDPVEAARFVVSDAVRAIWLRTRMLDGAAAFAEQASGQLLRWESHYGWTRFGEGQVAEREVTLAEVLDELLVTPDMFNEFAVTYVAALKGAPKGRGAHSRDLREWHAVLSRRLAGSEQESLIDKLPAPRGV